jgi:hypothetical protein
LACRAGTTTLFHTGATISSAQANFNTDLPSEGNAGGANRGAPLPVGALPPNAFGLHDVHGNVAEWCLDLYPLGGAYYHNVCGGSFDSTASGCRSDARIGWTSSGNPTIGFRVLRTVTPDARYGWGPDAKGTLVPPPGWGANRVDKAFTGSIPALLPGVLVLPPVYAYSEEERKLLSGGGSKETVIIAGVPYALAANIAVAYGPHRRMSLSPRHADAAFEAERLNQQPAEVSAAVVERCLAAVDCKLYARPRLRTKPEGHLELDVELHGDVAHPSRTVTHPIPREDWSVIPGLVALDVLDWLGVRLDGQEQGRLRQPLCRTNIGPAQLSDFLNGIPAQGQRAAEFRTYLEANPSVVAWYIYLTRAADMARAQDLYAGARTALPCDLLDVTRATLLRESGRLREAFEVFLTLAPTHRGDPYYHKHLTQLGVTCGEPGLVDRLLNLWRKEDQGPVGATERGGFLYRWAWSARGHGFIDTVTEEALRQFDQRLQLARHEFESAIRPGVKDPNAHSCLILVAQGLGLPREYAKEHYQAAVAANPDYAPAYRAYFDYLLPRWQGDASLMLEFARDCAGSSLWAERIPDLFLRAVYDVAYDHDSGLYSREVFRSPFVWEGLRRYYKGAQDKGLMAVVQEPYATMQDRCCSYFLHWGTLCGKAVELKDALSKIVHPDLSVFPDYATYLQARDRVTAESAEGSDRIKARLRLALAAGRYGEAERILGVDDDWPAAVAADRERYRKALAAGRRLARDGKITFRAREMLDSWTVNEPGLWRAEGDALICAVPAGKAVYLHCPFPVGQATVQGVLEVRGAVKMAMVVLHSRCGMDPVHLRFYPGSPAGQTRVMRYFRTFEIQPLGPGPQRLRIEIGPKHDHFVLNDNQPGLLAELPEFEPGGFGFEIYTEGGEGEFVLGPLEVVVGKQ